MASLRKQQQLLLELFEGYFLFVVGDSVLTSSLVLAVAALRYVFCKFGKLAAAAFAAARDANGCLDFIYFELVGVFLLGLLVLLVGVFTVSDGVRCACGCPLFVLFLPLFAWRSIPKGRKSLLWTHFLHISEAKLSG